MRNIPIISFALSFLDRVYYKCARTSESIRSKEKKKHLLNNSPTILSNDCLAGVLMNIYDLPCKAPIINCSMNTNDYVRYLENIEHYRNCELVEKRETGFSFPIGELVSDLGNIEIQFTHYASFDEAYTLWRRRSKRIDLGNMNVILDLNPYMMADDTCVQRFLDLPYNKVIITTCGFKDTICSHYIELGKKKDIKGIMLMYKNILGYRYFDSFDFITWLHQMDKEQS